MDGDWKWRCFLDTETLDCPICVEPLSIPVYQCENGHLICSACSTKVSSKGCPSCSRPTGHIRCLAVEKILESLLVPCKHGPHGCKEMFRYNDIAERDDHEKRACSSREIFRGCVSNMEKAPPPHNGMYPSYVGHRPRREKRQCPLFTLTAVIACIAVFVVVMYRNNCPAHIVAPSKCILQSSFKRISFQPWKENPLLGPSSLTLQNFGGLRRYLVVTKHQGWRLMSCVWLHAGVFHLVMNMVTLLVFGIQLERDFGFLRIGLLYLIAGLGGSLLSALFNSNAISVGASGALFGLLGATLSELITNWSHYRRRCSQLFQLIVVISVNLAIGLLPRVDNFAHIGGFVTGFLLGFVMLMKEQYAYVRRSDMPDLSIERPVKHRFRAYQFILFVLSIMLLIGGFAAGFALLYSGMDAYKKCNWCRYLNCVPSSHWVCDANSG